MGLAFILLVMQLILYFNYVKCVTVDSIYKKHPNCQKFTNTVNIQCKKNGYAIEFIEEKDIAPSSLSKTIFTNLQKCKNSCKGNNACFGITYENIYNTVTCQKFTYTDSIPFNANKITKLKLCCKNKKDLSHFYELIDSTCKSQGIKKKKNCISQGAGYFSHWTTLNSLVQLSKPIKTIFEKSLEKCQLACEKNSKCVHVTFKIKTVNSTCNLFSEPKSVYVGKSDTIASILVCCGSSKKEKETFCSDMVSVGTTQCEIYCNIKTNICRRKNKKHCLEFCMKCLEVCERFMTTG